MHVENEVWYSILYIMCHYQWMTTTDNTTLNMFSSVSHLERTQQLTMLAVVCKIPVRCKF